MTQSQPGNVNVSIRINSPGDDGPVTQINAAGGDVVTVVQPPSPAPGGKAPAPEAPPTSELPDNWTWVWTSACFGGGGGAQPASAASAGTGWNWQWSCGENDPVGGLPLPGPDGPLMPSPVAAAGDLVSSTVGMPTAGLPATPAKARPQRRKRPDGSAGGSQGPSPPSASLRAAGRLAAPPRAAPVSRATAAPAARGRRDARRAAHARAVVNTDFPPGASGPSAGAATGLGAALSLLLGAWTAVLVCALALVVPRMRRRRWSGPPWRLPPPRPARLERPG